VAEPLVFPASFSQRRPWLQEQLDPGRALYNVPFAIRLEGVLDVPALHAALDAIVERHEVLRTTFGAQDGTPVQVIAPVQRVALPLVDLGSEDSPERAAEALAAAEAARPFDLARGPLLRATLLRLGGARHVLLLTAHHGVFDGWSAGVFFRELAAAYAAHRDPSTAPLPELPLQYADYAEWEAEWLAGATAGRQLAYWREQLQGAPEVLELPADRPRPAVASHRGATHHFDLPAGLVAALRRLAQGEGATPFMVLLAAFEALLGRLTGQDDVVVGTPVANRGRVEVEGLVGCFVNTLALRTSLAGDPTFRQLIARVRRTAVAAYAHQELPFDRVVEELRPQRSLAFSPLFQVMFTLQQDLAPEELPGLELALAEVASGTAKLDLTLFLKEHGPALRGVVEYATDLFDEERVARTMLQFRALLEGAADRPDTPLSRLPLLPEAERRRVVEEWNQTELPLPAEWVHEQIAAQARSTPEAVAVTAAGGACLTYGALERRAEALAARLQERGVGPEQLVGLFLERTPDLAVALLGVLKAGAAYLPLDPGFPPARLAGMIADSGVPTILASRGLAAAVPPSPAAVLVLEDLLEGNGAPTPRPLAAASLAYVLYTSGSTGRPKGVAVSHGALLNFLESVRRTPGLGAGDRLCAVTTLSFDIAALELFLPLLVGARVVLADRETAADGRALAALLRSSGSTVLQATPATWRLLLEAGWDGSPRLTALCGGEALPRELAEALRPRVAALWNMYGPTETTVWSACQHVTEGAGPVPVGGPLANTQAYVLDATLGPVPIGVTGELYLGGAGVARGYLGRPDLTAERFVPDPLTAQHPGARLYGTGDLARWRSDGTLEVLGRRDHQVKVRGFRIELEEVEEALLRHPSVARAVVAAREDGTGENALVAWVVPREGATAGSAEWRELLRGALPAYMVPSAFVTLPALPLTPNGKVDRRALPAPDVDTRADLRSAAGFVAPRTAAEEAVAAIWRAVLEREAVGVHDNFFELGGHSLLAARVMARLRQVLGVETSLRALFQAPTVAGLAALVERDAAGGRAATPDAIVRAARGGDLPLSRGQERLWFVQRMAPDRPVYNVPLALRLRGALDTAALEQAVTAVVERHETLRTAFPSRDGRPAAVVGGGFTVEHTDLSTRPGNERAAAEEDLVRDEARRAFDVEDGPLGRVRLARLDATDHVLVVTLHHLVCDLWSLGLLLRELSEAYAAALGGPPALGALEVQYADYAAWQRSREGDGGGDAALDRWARRLEGLPVLDLPADRARPPVQSFTGATVARPLPRRLGAPLEALAAREGATLFVVLLAAFKAVLHRYTGQGDLAVGSPVSQRERPELEALVGLFVNTLVLRTDLRGDPTFRELVGRVRETVLEAHAYREIPFERLVERLQPRRALDRNPLFQVAFLFDRAPLGPLELPGVGVEPLEATTGTAKFDLMLAVGGEGEGLTASVEYATDLFDQERMERFLGHFETLLDAALADPDRPLSTLALLTPAERRQALVEWNDTAIRYPLDVCLHELIEQQVRATPGAVALVGEQGSLTYAELNRRANQLAHWLRAHGVGPDVPVGVCMERSLELEVALLAVLKAGGAYVPLDPSYPAERLAFMVEETRVPVVLAQERLRAVAPARGARVLCLDGEWERLRAEAPPSWDTDPVPLAGPENLAYIIYTSGSTGRPKGAMNTHRGICNRLLWMQDAYRLGPADRVLQKTPFSFDVSVWEFFWPLMAGAALVMARPEGHRDAGYLAGLIAAQGITTLHFVPSMLQAFLDEPRAAACRSLRRVICSGEALPFSLQERFFGVLGAELHNLYGPTEAAVDVTYWPCARGSATGVVPIGRPIANTQIHVLDARLQPVPAGVPGELFIGGEGLARGYVASADKTAARFVPDPLASAPGARLYRTGDRATRTADGTLLYLGRLDRQAKLRGFRIEPGEVEAALAAQPGVQQAAVLVREDVPGDKRLVAYVVGALDPAAAGPALRAALRLCLPEHMVPAHVVVLERLPLSPNGKVDAAALPAPAAPAPSASSSRAPHGATEVVVAEVWREVLKLDVVGVRDNFFDLGGNSLLLLQAQSRLARRLGREVPLVEMFRHGTVEALAAHLGGGAPAADGTRGAQGRGLQRREALERRRRELARR
jgi:amino acid adenylation domain-containing protein